MKKFLSVAVASLMAISMQTAIAAPEEINISYVPQPFNLQSMVMNHNGMLEKEFEKDGIKINWHRLNTGPKQSKAMAAGELDISPIMNTASILMANSEGNPVLIATGTAHPSNMYAIVGKPGESFTPADLKGKTIAGPKGTFLHQLLVAVLAKNGMTIDDVNFVNLDIPKSLATVLAGKADVALVAASSLIKANENGAKTITTAEGYVMPTLVMTSSGKFAKENPELLKRVVKVNKEALEWIKNNKDAALEIGAKEHKISKANAQKLYDWSNFFAALTDKDIQAIKNDHQFMLDNKMIRNKVNLDTLVLPIAFEN